uniref:Chemokine interleukin-8-like domain-containing protein n=1 Tax=Cyprinodon variegatus TaxID=28743 RepID=A0A3Q2D133_CYPVA
MNPSFQCILLLACITITILPMRRCRCPNPKQIPKAINLTLIADVIQYKPRPYCNRYEVIVTLKNKTKTCLDPKSKFTIALLQINKNHQNNLFYPVIYFLCVSTKCCTTCCLPHTKTDSFSR